MTSTGILRVSRDHVRLAWAALSYINEIDGRKTVIRITRVSGTIKKCEIAAIKKNKSRISNQFSAISRFEIDKTDKMHETENLEE